MDIVGSILQMGKLKPGEVGRLAQIHTLTEEICVCGWKYAPQHVNFIYSDCPPVLVPHSQIGGTHWPP